MLYWAFFPSSILKKKGWGKPRSNHAKIIQGLGTNLSLVSPWTFPHLTRFSLVPTNLVPRTGSSYIGDGVIPLLFNIIRNKKWTVINFVYCKIKEHWMFQFVRWMKLFVTIHCRDHHRITNLLYFQIKLQNYEPCTPQGLYHLNLMKSQELFKRLFRVM